MFGEKYSRKKYWIILISLLVPLVLLRIIETVAEAKENTSLMFIVAIGYFIIAIAQLNTLANRIRDYGSNPWLSLLALIPLVNLIVTFYYGIVQQKSENKNNDSKSPSLTKAVINHTKDIACDIKPKVNGYIEKHSNIQCNDTDTSSTYNNIEKLSEDEIYEKVMIEIEEDKKIKSTWAKAFSKENGDENKAKALYINLRVEEIKDSENQRIDNMLEQQEEQEKQLKIKQQEELEKEMQNGLMALEVFKQDNNIISAKKIQDNLYLVTFSNSPIDTYIQWNGSDWEFTTL